MLKKKLAWRQMELNILQQSGASDGVGACIGQRTLREERIVYRRVKLKEQT